MTDSELSDAVQAAREKRLAEKGVDADTEDAPELLLGECQQNAAAVRDELQSRGISCRVVGGALHTAYPPGEIPDSFADTKADGFGVHYWVEANGHICEIASESEHHWGEAIAVAADPGDLGYTRFEDSLTSVPF